MKFNYNPEYTPNPVAKLIDFDVVSTYVCPVEPLEIKEPTMTTAIEIGKTYKLVEPEIKTNALISGHKTLTDVFGEGEFTVEDFEKSKWFTKSYIVHGRRLDNNKIEKILVYEAEFILFQEVEEQDPTDLLTRAVAIKTPFISVCGWVTDQWIEDGVELLNVVHAGDFSVVPRSAVVAILN
ncbi:transcriptional regulator [Escherichia phage vB_EcoM_Nami]|nr:transcriptional regulator [Escherichia phage vB_EcoM_Nami]WBF79843.1 transcriptional regulator [Escherichia phage vB_Eco_F25]